MCIRYSFSAGDAQELDAPSADTAVQNKVETVSYTHLVKVGIYIIVGYLIVLVVYSILTYIQYSVKYFRAKKSVREYYQDLTRLEKIYGREEKRNPVRRNAGGHRK